MRIIIIAFLALTISTVNGQGTTHEVEPVGIYKEIDTKNDIAAFKLLNDASKVDINKRLKVIEDNANIYTPAVLYNLSYRLIMLQKFDDAAFWFYVAQLRARYDVNRCADKTANASEYNQAYGPAVNTYALKDLDNLESIVKKVVAFVRANDEKYDQRWINLSGMDAMNASLGGKVNKDLSVDKSLWPSIKAKTIDTYYSDFNEMLASQRKK